MRSALTIVVLLAVTVVTGCTSSSPRGGGESDSDGFTLSVPRAAVVLRPGQERDVTVSVHRGHRFRQVVAVGIRASDGVSAAPNNVLYRPGERAGAAVRVSAGAKTGPGDYRVYVKGTPQDGNPTSIEFVVRVKGP